MANNYFQFKQFTIFQDQCAMKVSTDAAVLGALASQDQPENILDIGTGTGVIALMMAQRFEKAQIKALEIDSKAFTQASENIAQSPWADQVKIEKGSFQNFSKSCSEKFDLIVSNPPYYTNHNKSKDKQRNLALHNDELPFGDLIKGVLKLLEPNKGKFWVILPPNQMKELEKIANFFELYSNAFYELRDRPSTKVLRQIKSFSFSKLTIPEPTSICIKDEDFSYSQAYKHLLKDFLTIF
ncbi:methyltransferase [Echinicola marina]|uniref:tRNA1(Val) (adenine(37)-N6)-methyltransferase n=1 Tax=Echinicola marina TaxID=2859768 RepID=UPI001CF710C1|nr:methyltransferase [Echinicola marina]UCS95145.1 methyltransferase [Echinicola marina]